MGKDVLGRLEKLGEVCPTCGVPTSSSTTKELWDIYDRIDDGRSRAEPLVFTQDYLEENGIIPGDDSDSPDNEWPSVVQAMERDMHNRGLCVTCGRPNLAGVGTNSTPKIMTIEEARDAHAYWAEVEAERRAGC